jgi:hypothetical protein
MISPLGARVTFVYTTRMPELEIRIDHPTDRLEVVVAGLNLKVTGATPAESSITRGQPVYRYTADDLLPGATVSLAVAGRQPGAGSIAVVWVLIGVGLLLAAGILWMTGDRGSRRLRTPPVSR